MTLSAREMAELHEDLHCEIDALRAQRDELLTVLRDCAELLDDYSDVNDGEDGQPVANRAMSLLRNVEHAIEEAETYS